MKKKLLAALLATAMTVTMFAGCGTPGSKDSKKDDSSASSGKKRITYTLREDLPSMDPQNSNSISCATAEICTYAMLTRNVEGEIKPDAAESWDISDDGLTYTFHLRDGLKWSDGEDVKQAIMFMVSRDLWIQKWQAITHSSDISSKTVQK